MSFPKKLFDALLNTESNRHLTFSVAQTIFGIIAINFTRIQQNWIKTSEILENSRKLLKIQDHFKKFDSSFQKIHVELILVNSIEFLCSDSL